MKLPKRIKPRKGQESVWDYPRPPKLELTRKTIEIYFNNVMVARTNAAYRVLETSHPPNYYLPLADINSDYLEDSEWMTSCEFKGQGSYYHLKVGNQKIENAAWYYDNPTPAFAAIKGYPAFYANKMDRCLVDGVEVTPQPGEFYGGWITPEIVGPFKGGPGTMGW